MSTAGIAGDDLWMRRLSRRLRTDRLAEVLFGSPKHGPGLLAVLIVLLDGPILSAVGYTETGSVLLAENPGEWVLVVAWPVIVWMTLRLERTYHDAIRDLPPSGDEDVENHAATGRFADFLERLGVPKDATGPEDVNFHRVVPDSVKYGVLALGLTFHFAWWLFDPGAGEVVTAIAGPAVAAIKFYGIYPLLYYPLGVEFAAVFFGITVLLPFKLRRAGVLDFTDPSGFLGLEPAGQLYRSAAVTYFLLLTLFAAFTTVARGTNPDKAFPLALIIAGTVVGVILFYAPIYWTHVHMRAAKDAKIDAIAQRIRDYDPNGEMLPNVEPQDNADVDEYNHRYIQLTRVENAKEFPVDLSILQEVMFALVLPYFTSIAFDTVLTSM